MNTSQKLSIPKFSVNTKITTKYLCFTFACLILSATFLFSLTLGATKISVFEVFSENISLDNPDFRIFFYIRLPRALAALLAGSALAVSGVIIQAVLNNTMAAPNIIGVNSGAGFLVVLVMTLFPDAFNLIPFSSFIGAFITCMLIYLLAKKTGVGRTSITFAGIAVSSILNSGISMLKTISPDSIYNMSSFSIGGLGGIGFDVLKIPSVMNVEKTRFLFLTLASILAGATVSFSGLIGFVGLVIPHIVRIFTGNRHRLLIPLAAIFGAELMLVCDIISRTLFKPYEIPVGIILSIIGGFFFIFLILTQRKRRVQ